MTRREIEKRFSEQLAEAVMIARTEARCPTLAGVAESEFFKNFQDDEVRGAFLMLMAKAREIVAKETESETVH